MNCLPRHLARLLFGGLLLGTAIESWAKCFTWQRDVVVTPASPLIVDPTIEMGQPLNPWVGVTYDTVFRCQKDVDSWSTVEGASGATTMSYTEDGRSYPIHPTGVAGIGVVIRARDPARSFVVPRAGVETSLIGPYWWNALGVIAQARFIRTGQIAPGTMPRKPLGTLRGRRAGYDPAVASLFVEATEFRIQLPTCLVTPNNNQPVQLGNIAASSFSGVGSTSPAVTFPIRLDCSGGSGTAAVHAVLTDATNTANRSANLSLTPASTARGLALQVLKDGNVLSYGPDSSAAGTANQWPIATLGNQTHTFNLAARYVQTAASITPGSANGVATITLSYQ